MSVQEFICRFLKTSHYERTETTSHSQDEDLDTWIEEQVATYPKITTEELASQSGKGIRTIKRHIAKMKKL